MTADTTARPGYERLPEDEENEKIEDIREALRDVLDPELGVNVVDLGLVYGVIPERNTETGTLRATLDMTLTSAACPLTEYIEEQTGEALKDAVDEFSINWVWMPPWDLNNITEDGREQLRAIGFNI
jgi:metal-sulfur cluster biosynthetic enzyme